MIPNTLIFMVIRIIQILCLTPIIGMLAWFVHGYVKLNRLTPNYILVLFIGSTLAAAWSLITLLKVNSARRNGFLVGVVDFSCVAALIAGVYTLRYITRTKCTLFGIGSINIDFGIFGRYDRSSKDGRWYFKVNKPCVMLKASFGLAIVGLTLLFVTACIACLTFHESGREGEKLAPVKQETVKRTTSSKRSGSRNQRHGKNYHHHHHHNHQRRSVDQGYLEGTRNHRHHHHHHHHHHHRTSRADDESSPRRSRCMDSSRRQSE